MTTTLSDSVLFPVLEEEHLQNLEACGTILKLMPEQVLFKEGDITQCFYVVLDGQIKITKQLG
nr:cyclic nucleotide-binding domain-containing protein [Pleurocapsa sp. MO_192.B19]